MATKKDDLPTFTPDSDADWIKRGTWDLPPYLSPQFFQAIGGEDRLEQFKQGVVYQAGIDQGLIIGDEWAADYINVPTAEPDDEDTDTDTEADDNEQEQEA